MAYKFIDIDFETRSTVNLLESGAHKYAIDESTQILICAFSIDEECIANFTILNIKKCVSDFVALVKTKIQEGYKIRAFNSMFEYLIWNHVGVGQFGFPALDVSNFYCVMAEACAMGFPASLENCGKALNLNVQKMTEGKALIRFFCVPKKNASGLKIFNDPKDHPEKFELFTKYCEVDVEVQIDISKRCRKLNAFQYDTFLLTERMNIRGLPIDYAMIRGAQTLSDASKLESDDAIKLITNGAVNSPAQTKALTKWLNAKGYKMPNLQAPTIERKLKDPKSSEELKSVLRIRKDGSKSSIAKFVAADNYNVNETHVHDFIKYHIASTGRWGGRGLQIQNFSKPPLGFPKWYDHELLCRLIAEVDVDYISGLYGSISEALKASVRGLIKAPKGKKFVGADYAQIEARIVMWLANDATGLQDFAGAGKIYESMAGTIFNMPADAVPKSSFQRDVGKETVLGCGFGMGWKKFLHRCVMDRGLSVDQNVAQKAVAEYRTRYKKVPLAWKTCEQMAIKAIENPGETFYACDNRLSYCVTRGHLFAKLPSGRHLSYPQAFVSEEPNDWGHQQKRVYYYAWNQKAPGNKWVPCDIWGGTLFQHGVQAIAADVMACGMLNAEGNKYKSIFTVHDESVALVIDSPRYNKDTYEKMLCDLPEWAKGMPIKAEGFEGPRYKKF